MVIASAGSNSDAAEPHTSFMDEAKASGTVVLCFKAISTIFSCKSFCLIPVALNKIELAMKLGIKKKRVA